MQSSATTATPRLSQYWSSSVSRCLIFLLAAMLTLSLASCATTGNIPPNYDVLALKNSGLVLFSVTHDKDTEYLFRRGTDMRFNVYFRNANNNIEIPAAFSNDTLALIVTSQFEVCLGARLRARVCGRELRIDGVESRTGLWRQGSHHQTEKAATANRVRRAGRIRDVYR